MSLKSDHFEILTHTLVNTRYTVDSELKVDEIIAAIDNYETDLLQLLLKEATLKSTYFKEVNSSLIFLGNKLIDTLHTRSLAKDQLTSYRNKIGLATTNKKSHNELRKIVLSYPYKDSVLIGSQTKENKSTKDQFLHQVIHKTEIDRLYTPKAFTNWRRYDNKGNHALKELSHNDNLIIKGNNLLVLHSLLPTYGDNIKLIYIDPPYNTTNDGFRYLDSFNHSSWLTFMRNRLEVAMKLLSDDGLLWISISDREAHYLKVLCDEIIGRENFVADIIWNSTKSVTNTAVISDAHTHTLLFVKDIKQLKINRAKFRLAADESKFSNPDNDPRGKWIADPFQVGGVRPNQLYTITNPNTGVTYTPNPGNSWKNEKKIFDQLMKEGRIVFGTTGEAGPQRKRFWSEAKDRGQVTTTLWKDLATTTNGTAHLKKIFGSKVFDNPKPEALLERIIQLSTEEGDIVLDYHLGSGTTATVAHKMKRQYIGIEQMDYIKEVTCERLKAVIDGEQGGISINQSWKGGGSFVYTELMPLSAKYLEGDIEKVLNDENILWDIRLTTDISEIINNDELTTLQKNQLVSECLDLNMLYLPYSEIRDDIYKVNVEDQKWSDAFYSLK